MEHLAGLNLHGQRSLLQRLTDLRQRLSSPGSMCRQSHLEPGGPLTTVALVDEESALHQVAGTSHHGGFGLKRRKSVLLWDAIPLCQALMITLFSRPNALLD